jgi:hypothetical protein
MAGGYKLFSTGEVLTAANVNNYLMNQTVMVFASAAARTTALSGVLAEGMISYRSDAKVLEIYNGTTWITESAFTSPLTTKGDVHTYSTTDARLPVGTTNQTLIVDSTQTTGIKWAASPQSTLSAKGSLISASAANTLAELTVGSDGQTLVANSAATTGLQWASTPSASNPILNSSMQIWQRGTSVAVAASTTNAYTADRWSVITNASQATTISRQATGDTTNLPNIQYALRFQRNSGQTGTGTYYFGQSVETLNSIPFAGKTVTLSFYARAGANYSATSNALGTNLVWGTGTDQSVTSGTYTGATTPISQTTTLTTTWQRFTYTAAIGATATEFGIYYTYTPTGTAGTNDYFEITGVQIDIGSVALPFRTFSQTLQGELAACQRYYFRSVSTSSYGWFGSGMAASTTSTSIGIPAPVTMRTVPTSVDFSTLAVVDAVTSTAVTSCTIDSNVSDNQFGVVTAGVASGLTQYRPYYLRQNASSGGYIGFSAEL